MKAPLCIIAAGGTGGHMFPAQALVEALMARGWRVRLSTDPRGARFAGSFPIGVETLQVPSATPARGGLMGKLLAPFAVLAGTLVASFRMITDRPRIIVGFGGYPTIPALAAGTLLRIPRMIHEQNGVLGRVNEVFAPRVNAVACGSWPTELPRGVLGHHTGNPVRKLVLGRAGTPYAPPGEGEMSILVMGGSQGARILSDMVPEALASLPEAARVRLSVAHQARSEDEARVREAYTEAGLRAEVKPFFEDIPRRIAEAQLVISRAGASSVADISVVGRPSVLIPFAAAAGDHQTANARGLVDAGAAILIPESKLSPAALAQEVLRLLSTPGAAQQMARNAVEASRPDATERLADMAEKLSGEAS